MDRFRRRSCFVIAILIALGAFFPGNLAWSETASKVDRTFNAAVTDSHGVDTDIKNVIFYWEEKISETAFVPHELREVPVKRGSSTIKVKFDQIKQIDVKLPTDSTLPSMVITLSNGKTGEFVLAVNGSFKGASEFGDTEFPASGLKRIVLK